MEEEKDVPIRVSVRAKPLIELETDSVSCVQFAPDLPQIIVADEKDFTFDNVFAVDVHQKEVYQTCVAPLVKKVLQGYNATVLAYGQTGTGKTYTMGTDYRSENFSNDSIGIIPRCLEDIFSNNENSGFLCDIKVSFLEIYNEEVLDLLCIDKQREPVVIREQTNTVQVSGLEKKSIHSPEDALQWLEKGTITRTTGATAMNANSSRSHTIFTIYIEMTNDEKGICKFSKLHLVDLAGSETVHKTKTVGDRFREGININLSLLALGNVIRALFSRSANPHIHVPYRESALTRLLKDSLGENSYTMLIACISIAYTDVVETLNTLRYADMVRQIKNKPVINKVQKDGSLLKRKMAMLPPTPVEWKKRMNISVSSCAPTPTPVKKHINRSVDASMLTSTACKQWDRFPPKFCEPLCATKDNELSETLSQHLMAESKAPSPNISFMPPQQLASINSSTLLSPLATQVCNKLEKSMFVKFHEFESTLLVHLKKELTKSPTKPASGHLTPSQIATLKSIRKKIRKSKFFSSPFKDKTNTMLLSPVFPVEKNKLSDNKVKRTNKSTADVSETSELNDTVLELASSPPLRRSHRISMFHHVPAAQIKVKKRQSIAHLGIPVEKTDCTDEENNLSELNDTVIKMPEEIGCRVKTRSRTRSLLFSRKDTATHLETTAVLRRIKGSKKLHPESKSLKTHNHMLKDHNAQILNLLNTGSPRRLQKLPCIGPKRAYIISTWLKFNGPLQSISDLDKIRGLAKSFSERFADANFVTMD